MSDALATVFATPREPEGFPYLRFEPVVAPAIVLRDPEGVSSPGSAIDRLVLRTFNDSEAKDGDAADLTGSERHIVPPRTSVELAERLGMFDDAAGKLRADPATYALIKQRDEGKIDDRAGAGPERRDADRPQRSGDDPLSARPAGARRGAARSAGQRREHKCDRRSR